MREVDEDTPLPLDGIHITDVDSSDTQGRGAPSSGSGSGSMASRFAAHAMVELYVEVTYGTLTFEAGGTGHVSGISVVEGYGTATGDEVDRTSVRTVTLRHAAAGRTTKCGWRNAGTGCRARTATAASRACMCTHVHGARSRRACTADPGRSALAHVQEIGRASCRERV